MIRLICCLMGILLALAAWGQQRYRREVLYRIPFGSAQGQVGVIPGAGQPWQGPAQFLITNLGVLYLADLVNHRVVAFDAQGKPLLATPRLAQGPQSIALDLLRNIYALDGPRAIREFSPAGQPIYAITTPADLPELQCLYPAFDDAICARTGPHTITVFDQQGEVQHAISGDVVSNRRLVASVTERASCEYQLTTSTLGRRLIGGYSLELLPQTLAWLRQQDPVPVRVAWHVDADDYIYMVVPVRAQPRAGVGTTLIVVFDRQGRQDTVLRVSATPFSMVSQIDVDDEGNLYHLEVESGALALVRERLLAPRVKLNEQVPAPPSPPMVILLVGLALVSFGVGYAGYAWWHRSRAT